jgi:signal transduction histidine kinase
MSVGCATESAKNIVKGSRFHEGEVLLEQVKQLYSLAPIGISASLMNSVIAFFIMREVLPYRLLIPWLAAVLGISALRMGLVFWFRSEAPESAAAPAWKFRFQISLILIGLAWGSIALVPFSFSLAHQVFLAFVLGGMAAGASSTFSKIRHGDAYFSIPALLPLTVHFLLIGDPFHHAMAAMAFLYITLLSQISRHNYRVNRDSLQLNFDNQDMIESLTMAKEAVENLNAQLCAENKARREAEALLTANQAQLELIVEERTADLVQARDAAEAGNRAKSEFLANMSHEMRTPLAGLLGMIKLVLDMEISAEERELLEMAQRSADSLLRIIADLLDFSSLEAGSLKFECKAFSLAETVQSALEVVAISARTRGLQLSWQVDQELPQLLTGDGGRLRQVLVNLLGNAVKFTPKGGIELAVRPLPDSEGRSFLLFSVKDTGVGIPADQLEKIFDKFTQIDSSLTKNHGGTGLGLALSRQIVEKMGGSIWVESSIGLGSTFFFTLPQLPALKAV